ncbi:hypothetical protein BDQ12DRAFT_621381 [Crucibulum laeve]|uniref:BZIP domain-containing protein n=1 Tax=Crucibulum laeve TaxID=68775 RepID=A0A5C3MJ38_9AGAR|nr:hypothetical protein BDQ12DRAFT_621381 [Crucibulum laeve]
MSPSNILPLSIPMSQIIASDAPLLSPVSMHDHHWDSQQPLFSPTHDNFFNYYNLPPSPPHSDRSTTADSPIPTARMLKMRMTPDNSCDGEQLCLPTHQLFDFPQVHPPAPPSPALSSSDSMSQRQRSVSIIPSDVSTSAKRSASPAPSVPKKRTVGERINSKDFVPPDVSGLSKREARLVKNRAAAFLSRQRKREEFECMEVRVAELEQENARLLALTQNGNSTSPPKIQSDNELVSEVEQLRAQLAAAKERELELSVKLSKAATKEAPIKIEASETQFPLSSPPRSSSIPSSHRSGASLGLMVLLCALPTLLSMPMHSAAPTSFSIPTPFPASSSAFDFNSYVPNEYDWSRTNGASMMDLSDDDQGRLHHTASASASATRRLEFSGVDSNEFGGLGGLDISFDASPSDDGKIRVRIHPSSSASSRATSPGATYSSSKPEMTSTSSSSSLEMWAGPQSSEPSFQASFSQGSSAVYPTTTSSDDPFLGIGASSDFGLPYAQDPSSMMYTQMNDMSSSLDYGQLSDPAFGIGSDYSINDPTTGGKRRVRIALKSMPAAGGEGGEWEVQIC